MTARIMPGEATATPERLPFTVNEQAVHLLDTPDRRSRARRVGLLASKATGLDCAPARMALEGAASRFEANLLAPAEAGR